MFQIRDLLFGVCDLLFGVYDLLVALGKLPFALDHLAPQILNLSLQPLVFPPQLFPAGLIGVPMTICRCPSWPCAACHSRTHPLYVKRFRSICPAKSTGYLNCYASLTFSWKACAFG